MVENRFSSSIVKTNKLLIVIIFSVFALGLLLSNSHDWDQFYSKTEVEVRSWVNDLTPPLWSYQLCAGVTRIGDPESFGLSPLILPSLLFGTFWGLKITIFLLTFVGWRSLRKLLELLSGQTNPALQSIKSRCIANVFSISFIFGNYFLWHLVVGHLTFALNYLVLAIIYLVVKAYYLKLSRKELVLLALSTWSWLAGPFYHSLVYFAFPVCIGGCFALALNYRYAHNLKRISLAASAFFIGVVCSSYKLLGVLEYQQKFPRTLSINEGQGEFISFPRLLRYLFIPTSGHQWLVLDPRFAEQQFAAQFWSIHEYSSFSLVSLLFVAAVILSLAGRNFSSALRSAPIKFAFCLILVGAVFSLGQQGSWSPFAILNTVLENSIRGPGRFQITLLFGFLVAGYLLLNSSKTTSHLISSLSPVLFLIVLFNLAGFSSLTDFEGFSYFTSLPQKNVAQMSQVTVARAPTFKHWTYEAILRGDAVANCYVPLNRTAVLNTSDLNFNKDRHFLVLPLDQKEQFKECAEKSWFTQNNLVLDQNCGQDICLAMNNINPQEANAFVYDKKRKLYCKWSNDL